MEYLENIYFISVKMMTTFDLISLSRASRTNISAAQCRNTHNHIKLLIVSRDLHFSLTLNNITSPHLKNIIIKMQQMYSFVTKLSFVDLRR